MSDKIYLSKRKWLNPKSKCDSGAIQYSVHSEYNYIEANMDIWDCSKKIGLTFSFGDKKNAKIRLVKINILIDSLIEMKKAMGKAYPDVLNSEEEE